MITGGQKITFSLKENLYLHCNLYLHPKYHNIDTYLNPGCYIIFWNISWRSVWEPSDCRWCKHCWVWQWGIDCIYVAFLKINLQLLPLISITYEDMESNFLKKYNSHSKRWRFLLLYSLKVQQRRFILIPLGFPLKKVSYVIEFG